MKKYVFVIIWPEGGTSCEENAFALQMPSIQLDRQTNQRQSSSLELCVRLKTIKSKTTEFYTKWFYNLFLSFYFFNPFYLLIIFIHVQNR